MSRIQAGYEQTNKTWLIVRNKNGEYITGGLV